MDVLSKLRITILTGFAIVSLCMGTVWAETELTGPATLNKAGEYYRLTEDITASGTAFTITASGVTLDLNGHTVTYDTSSGTSYGVHISASNTRVKNGFIIQGSGKSSSSHAVYITSGSGHELSYLGIKVSGYQCIGIYASGNNDFNNGTIHHVYVESTSTSKATDGFGASGINVAAMSKGGVTIYESILVGSHRGINAKWWGFYAETPTSSKIYNNFIQHDRLSGDKSPYGISLPKCQDVEVYNNQVISDNGRGLTCDGLGQGVEKGTNGCLIHDNRFDVQYSPNPRQGGSGYTEVNVYGIRCRYSSYNNSFTNNTVIVDNDVYGDLRAFYIGSDSSDSKMHDLLIQNNTIIARDPGEESGGAMVFAWDWADEITCTNNNYLTDGTVQKHVYGSSVGVLNYSDNNVLSPTPTSPTAPTGLSITRFLDSYLLRWNENLEADVYEYYVYRDGEKMSNLSPRGGTFYVDVGIGGTHTYSISALTLSGNEGPRCPEVSTTSAKIGWWAGSPPSSPSSLRIIN